MAEFILFRVGFLIMLLLTVYMHVQAKKKSLKDVEYQGQTYIQIRTGEQLEVIGMLLPWLVYLLASITLVFEPVFVMLGRISLERINEGNPCLAIIMAAYIGFIFLFWNAANHSKVYFSATRS